jgi:hypothetical protein
LNEAIEEYRTKENINEREKAEAYLFELYEEEGSIYEDNFFTQLIRGLLEQLEEKTGKKNALIIEDLDRIDPDHVFRILNVISAHYDTYKYSETQESHNKFGLDKIITVCDKNNIKSVFHHRFGSQADFTGYFNKFYSVAPFEFSNSEAIAFHIKLIDEQKIEQRLIDWTEPYIRTAKKVLWDLINNGQLTFRELIKFSKIEFYKDIYTPVQKSNKRSETEKLSLFLVLY